MVEILFHVVVFAVGFLIGLSSQRIAWVRSNRRLIHDLRVHRTEAGSLVTLTRENGAKGQQEAADRKVLDAITAPRSFGAPGKKGFARPNQSQRTT